jgi:hypothetical protein
MQSSFQADEEVEFGESLQTFVRNAQHYLYRIDQARTKPTYLQHTLLNFSGSSLTEKARVARILIKKSTSMLVLNYTNCGRSIKRRTQSTLLHYWHMRRKLMRLRRG